MTQTKWPPTNPGRFTQPAPVEPNIVMLVTGLGIVINTATALMFMRGREGAWVEFSASDPKRSGATASS